MYCKALQRHAWPLSRFGSCLVRYSSLAWLTMPSSINGHNHLLQVQTWNSVFLVAPYQRSWWTAVCSLKGLHWLRCHHNQFPLGCYLAKWHTLAHGEPLEENTTRWRPNGSVMNMPLSVCDRLPLLQRPSSRKVFECLIKLWIFCLPYLHAILSTFGLVDLVLMPGASRYSFYLVNQLASFFKYTRYFCKWNMGLDMLSHTLYDQSHVPRSLGQAGCSVSVTLFRPACYVFLSCL